MKQFNSSQRDAISAKLYDMERIIFISYDYGKSWVKQKDICSFEFYTDEMYIAVNKKHEEAASVCLLEGEDLLVNNLTYSDSDCYFTLSKETILYNKKLWTIFLNEDVSFTLKQSFKEMWIASSNGHCSKPYKTVKKLLSSLALEDIKDVEDGQVVGKFVINKIKILV